MTFKSQLTGYRIIFSQVAQKALNKLEKPLAKKIEQKLAELTQGKENLDIKKLNGVYMKLSLITLILSLIAVPLCYSMTPDEQLYLAVQFGNLEKAQSALQDGANSNNLDNCGYIPLHYAAYHGHIEIVKLLLTHGAHNTINFQSLNTGSTPLYYAVYRNYVNIVKLLIDAGASITLKNNDYISALDLARINNKQEIRHILEGYLALQKEAQENPTRATLRKAIQANYPNLVTLMLKNSVKNNVSADINELHLAKILGHEEIEHMLIAYLVSVNQTEKK